VTTVKIHGSDRLEALVREASSSRSKICRIYLDLTSAVLGVTVRVAPSGYLPTPDATVREWTVMRDRSVDSLRAALDEILPIAQRVVEGTDARGHRRGIDADDDAIAALREIDALIVERFG
jgi:hypothetical protein